MCIRYDALSFGGIREKRERESDEEDNRGRSKRKKKQKMNVTSKTGFTKNPGFFGFDFDPTSKIDEIDERQRERETEREIRN